MRGRSLLLDGHFDDVAQTKHEIQSLLTGAGAGPRHRFGQNFMIDQNLVRIVADAGSIAANDLVIEVGPGTGTLTEELLERAGRVVAVEIDRDLAALLRDRFAGIAKFELIEGDALAGKHGLNEALLSKIQEARRATVQAGRARSPGSPGSPASPASPVKLVANLPYNIASPLVMELLLAGVDLLAFTVQKEVADRLRAAAGDDAYGPLSVMAAMLSRVELLRTLPPQAFWPAPKIESALVRMTRDDRLGDDARAFSAFVHAVFAYRRKTIRKALTQAGYPGDELVAQLKLDPQARPETFPPETWRSLFLAVNSP